jgi:hypothetical protein
MKRRLIFVKSIVIFLLSVGFSLKSYSGTVSLADKEGALSEKVKSEKKLQAFNDYFRLLPEPQKIEILPGEGILFSDLKAVHLVNTKMRPVMDGILSGLPLAEKQARGTITLALKHNLDIPSNEGYILRIGQHQVSIEAKAQEGLFYGLQTLKQLMEDSRDQSVAIPSCRITDYPKIPYRSILLNFMRHLDNQQYYYKLIDRLASIKINALIIEFTDKIRYKKAPSIGVYDAMTVGEFAALCRYAHERNIEISPLVQGLGHVPYILKHEEYKYLRDDPNSDQVFDPLNPKTYELQFSLYDDALAATPNGKYLHVGGDEVGGLGKSALAKASGKTPFELQMYWLKKVSDYATAHHRIPIFWDDMVLKHTNLYETTYNGSMDSTKVNELWNQNRRLLDHNIALFPKDCIYNRWNYGNSKILGDQLAMDWYKSKNLKVMGATSSQPGWALMPRAHSNFQAMKDFSQLTAEKHMDGLICTVWDDWPVHFETVMRGTYDYALLTWNYSDISDKKAHQLFRHRFYAPSLTPDSCDFQDMLEDALSFWEVALQKKDGRAPYLSFPDEKNLIDLPDMKTPGAWSEKYKEKLESAEKALSRYQEIKKRIDRTLLLARRNAYAVSIMNQINELQNYSTKLLLLLKAYDNASVSEKQEKKELIKNCIVHFKEIRAQFIEVYGQSWIMDRPADYETTHFEPLLEGTDNNTDWMYVYELCINKKISEWLLKDNN